MIEKPSALQNICVIFKLFSLITFIVEIVLMIIEIRLNLKLRKLRVKGFEKVSEEERRRKHGKKAGIIAILSFVSFLLILIIGLATSKGRTCLGKYSLEMGVCAKCEDENCLDCTGDYTTCKTCKGSFMINGNGKCQNCNVNNQTSCVECKIDKSGGPTSSVCTKCADGFRFEDGTCVDCSATSNNCKSCSSVKCVDCFSGYFRDDLQNTCTSCDSKIKYCSDCTDANSCNGCDKSIANMDSKGTCTDCNTKNGWYKDSKTG
jgi:hypothetical protein